MKLLIIGSKGMLGTDLTEELSKTDNEVIAQGKEDLDITREQDMLKIGKICPDIIINCAAYADVDLAEAEKELCYDINVAGVKNLVDISKLLDTMLIQISTDYVFYGEKDSYDEDDKKSPLNYYGKTKSEGEDVIINNLDKYYIIRTSWLFGKNGKNFVDTILNLCKTKKEIKVVNDQFGSPTYSKDLSKAMIGMINNPNRYKYGVYHITNSGTCSWFEFASEIARLTGSRCKINPCTTQEFPRSAKRPRYSVLNNNKAEKLRHWKEALKEYLER